jgi:hypothetical protein
MILMMSSYGNLKKSGKFSVKSLYNALTSLMILALFIRIFGRAKFP